MMNKFIYLITTILLIGCSTKGELADSSIVLPEKYLSDSIITDTTTIAAISWQKFFPDTLLQSYIRTALSKNYSFLNTMERIALASNEVRLRKGAVLPSVSIGLNAGLQRFGRYTMDGVGNNTTNTPDLPQDQQIPSPYPNFNLGVSFQWEADIWGKLKHRRKAAAERYMSSVESARLAQTLLISELVTNYFKLLGLDYCRAIIDNAIIDTEADCNFTLELQQAGEVTQLASDQFNARLVKLKGQLLENQLEINVTERAICMLMGIFPHSVNRVGFTELEKLKFPSQVGIPAQLLSLRPDVVRAERELKASKYDVSAAKKAFYPSITLGGSAGFNAFDIGKWFLLPASLVYDLAAGISAPLFNRNEISVLWHNALSSQKIALNNYHETVLKSYEEVTRLMIESDLVSKRTVLKEQEVTIRKNATQSASELFRLGFIGYLEVLSAQEQYIDSQLERVRMLITQCQLQAELYRALGGGVE